MLLEWIVEPTYLPKENRIAKKIPKLPPKIITKNKVRASRLAELSLIVDTGGVYQGEKEPPNIKTELT